MLLLLLLLLLFHVLLIYHHHKEILWRPTLCHQKRDVDRIFSLRPPSSDCPCCLLLLLLLLLLVCVFNHQETASFSRGLCSPLSPARSNGTDLTITRRWALLPASC
jgi:hypothetical protein